MSTADDQSRIKYPPVHRQEDIFDTYHGNQVADPYQWLEDPDSEETKAFADAQNKLTNAYLKKCKLRQQYQDRLSELFDYPKYGCPFKRGNRYFYFYNSGLQNQSVMYSKDSLDDEGTVFFDPNKLSDDGTVALGRSTFTMDGRYFAYTLSKSGSDWKTVHFMEVENRKTLPDVLEDVKFSSLSWTHDNKGVFYNRYHVDSKSDGTETLQNLHQKLYYHYLGSEQSEDILCAEFPDAPKWMCEATVSDDGRYVVMEICEGCDPVNRLYYCDLEQLTNGITGSLQYVKLVDNFDAKYEYVTNFGNVFTFLTNLNAPNYKLINIDLTKPDMSDWVTLIPERSKDVLEWATCVAENKLFVCYLQDVKNVILIFDAITGDSLATLPLDVGTVAGFSGRKTQFEIFYQFKSFLTPGIIYHCDLGKDNVKSKIFMKIDVKGINISELETSQVFYKSKDGTSIPMFIVHKRGIKLDGSHPTLLYGYGGFNISLTPSFSTSRLIFIYHMGGIVAIPNIRGGGEYGEKWHKAGVKDKKQNVFDDFIAAAEFLIENKYTSSKLIAINGGSNGGLLVCACMNQRPDLFRCVVSQVGVLDMLKFHKFTIGHAWTTDYGCASDSEEEFNYIVKYSPLHNIKAARDPDVQYPALLLMTADHDDRVVPLHSYKFIATVQREIGSLPNQINPLLIRIETKAGHGGGKPTAKIIEEAADMYGVIAENLNISWQDSISSNSSL